MYQGLFQPRKRMTNSAWRLGGETAEVFPKMQGWKPDLGNEEKLASWYREVQVVWQRSGKIPVIGKAVWRPRPGGSIGMQTSW